MLEIRRTLRDLSREIDKELGGIGAHRKIQNPVLAPWMM
jgi:hypothetical protein